MASPPSTPRTPALARLTSLQGSSHGSPGRRALVPHVQAELSVPYNLDEAEGSGSDDQYHSEDGENVLGQSSGTDIALGSLTKSSRKGKEKAAGEDSKSHAAKRKALINEDQEDAGLNNTPLRRRRKSVSRRTPLVSMNASINRSPTLSPASATLPSFHSFQQLPTPGRSFPPTFAQSEFETIVRRLRSRHGKTSKVPLSLLQRRPQLVSQDSKVSSQKLLDAEKGPVDLGDEEFDEDFEFAGWGSLSYLDLNSPILSPSLTSKPTVAPCYQQHSPPPDSTSPTMPLSAPPKKELLGQLSATSIAGNAIFGSVFYSIPSIVAVSDILSPVSMFISCLILVLWHPVLRELGSSIGLNGGNYVYMLNFSGKTLSLVGAASMLLDVVTTGTTSAATASEYIAGELNDLPFPSYILAIIILVLFVALMLAGLKDGSKLTLTIFTFHCLSIFILVICAIVKFSVVGPSQLTANWTLASTSGLLTARSVFNGICIGFLGVTGIETVPTYIEETQPSAYPKILRNLLVGAFLFNIPLLFLLYALIPSSTILAESNVLAVLASVAAGKWLRILIVIDAVFVLCGGVLTGVIAACGILERLAQDKIIPVAFLKTLPVTKARWVCSLGYLLLCLVIYASTGFSLSRVSNLFSVAFMAVMGMYVLSCFLLKKNRPRISRDYKTNLWLVLIAMGLILMVIVGNVILSPSTLGIFAGYLLAIFLLLYILQRSATILRGLLWLLDNLSFNLSGRRVKSLRVWLIKSMGRARRNVICAWIRTDEISTMIDFIMSTIMNEQTTRLVFIHAYETVEMIPSELAANAKLLDEAFPYLTIDLVFVKGKFSPELLRKVADKLDVVPSLHFMGCPDGPVAEFAGARVALAA